MRDALQGLKTLASQTQAKANCSVCSLSEQTDRADKYNDFTVVLTYLTLLRNCARFE